MATDRQGEAAVRKGWRGEGMKIERILAAEEDAKRLLKTIKVAKAVLYGKDGIIRGQKAAAVKRASMDLTRSLAELRRKDHE